jgi:hypothetical protein
MSLLNELTKHEVWVSFYQRKKDKAHLTKQEENELFKFINEKNYLTVAKKIVRRGFCFNPPTKKLVNKISSGKKRTVYFFDAQENLILKLLSHLLYKYDNHFASNLYSFRKNVSAKRAVFNLTAVKNISEHYCYKLDIKDYFNSIDVNLLLRQLKTLFFDDKKLFKFFKKMLMQNKSVLLGQTVKETRGAMAGTPTSPFLANVFLTELDKHFLNLGVPYARYSDDVIVFAKTEEELAAHKNFINNFLKRLNLEVNQSKEQVIKPNEPWVFLGIEFNKGILDISPVTKQKIKDKIKRKSRAIYRWKGKNDVPHKRALKVMIKLFNLKFFENKNANKLTWSRWFFPLINTDAGLKEIDNYLQERIRYIATGKFNKGNYKKVPYEMLKECGYRSLVNEYYKVKGER